MKNTDKKVLVLGGSGFIGQRVVQHLLQRHLKVYCLVHRRPLPFHLRSGVREIPGTLEQISPELLSRFQPDIIIHLARIAGRNNWLRWLASRRSRMANRRLGRMLKRHFPQTRLVLVAGTLSYGNHGEVWINENTPLSPISFARFYARGEAPLVKALQSGEIKGSILRPAWVYGPGSWFEQFYLRPIREGGFVPIYGTGHNWMSLIHVEDCAGLIVNLALEGEPGATFNLFAGEPLRQRQFAELLSSVSGAPIRLFPLEEVRRRFGKVTAEAFSASQRVTSRHLERLNQFPYRFAELQDGLLNVLKQLNLI